MNHRILACPRLNHASSFNYFFKNTQRKLIIDQNFIANQILLNYRNHASTPTGKNARIGPKDTATSLGEATAKVLNCQESDAKVSQSLNSVETSTTQSIPFKVTPKLSRKAADIPKKSSQKHISAIIGPYLKLTKPNLTILVTLSSVCSYAISPYSVSIPQLLFLTIGTTLCSGAANAINMAREPEFDKRMTRTSGRPVVRGLITPRQAYIFSAVTGTIGVVTLYFGVNSTVSMLGFLNIVLYSWIYTSLKRKSIINTWVGAVVGAIPPLMGWAAASSSLNHPGAWCLAGLLYAWQFPHFNSLSHNIADQYKSAGYVMTSAEKPMLNARVALRYSILMFPLCFGLSYYGVTDWVFQFDSALANGWLTYLAYKFWRQQKYNYSHTSKTTAQDLAAANIYAKKLFWGSVWQLPAILILAMLHRNGQWNNLYDYLTSCRSSQNTKSEKNLEAT